MSIVNMHSHHGFVPRTPPVFSYTGDYRYLDEGGGHWWLELLSSGVLTFSAPNSAGRSDVFLVGGGQRGADGTPQYDSETGYGGRGGNGGECKTIRGARFRRRSYQVTIGGSGGNTVIEDIGTAISGGGSSGGSGGHEQGYDGAPGQPEFGEPGRKRYAGGGGGAYYLNEAGPKGYGKDGGGNAGEAGVSGTGGGGGGGWSYYYDSDSGQPGGSGAAIIRDSR